MTLYSANSTLPGEVEDAGRVARALAGDLGLVAQLLLPLLHRARAPRRL